MPDTVTQVEEVETEIVFDVTDEALNALVAKLNETVTSSRLGMFMTVGKLVADNIFHGDVAALQSRGGRDPNMARLLAHTGLEVKRSELSRSLRVFVLDDKLKGAGVENGVLGLQHLSATHFAAVLSLKFPEQKRLLLLAQRHKWPSRKLLERVEVARQKASAEERRGRPRLPAFQKTVHQFAKLLDDEDVDRFGDTEAIAEMDLDQARELRMTLEKMQGKITELQEALASRI
jgi:hypothetical protein